MARDSKPRTGEAPWPSTEPSRSNRPGGVEHGELLLRLDGDEARTSSRRTRSFSRSRQQRVGVVNRTRAADGGTGGLHSDSSEFHQFTRVGLVQC